MLFEELQYLAVGLCFRSDLIEKVLSVKGGANGIGTAEAYFIDYIFLDFCGGCSGKGCDRHIREDLWDKGKTEVIGPEIMSPFRYAMGLVYGKEGDRKGLEGLEEMGHRKTLRCDIEELYPVLFQVPVHARDFPACHRAVDESGRYSVFEGRVHLVFHQGDKRADDNRGSGHHLRRQLVAERFSAACRHYREHIPP